MSYRKIAMAIPLIVCSVFFFTLSVWAVPMTFDLVGVDDVNNQAQVVFSYNAGVISLDITNTSGDFDPRLTAFAFNAPTQVTDVSDFSFTAPPGVVWTASFAPDGINTPGQYGVFDIAGLTGPNFNGGFPNYGIPLGSTFSFSFTLLGSGLSSLTEEDFLFGDPYFIARFQRTGFDGEGSDVAIPTGGPAPVPEPGTLLLMGIGLSGIGLFRRWRSQPR